MEKVVVKDKFNIGGYYALSRNLEVMLVIKFSNKEGY